jgi:hypothetical protein
MNPFTERYITLSNTDLLKIIDNQADYQPLAVETAVAELSRRQLGAEELEGIKAGIDLEQQEKTLKKLKQQAFENKVKDIGAAVVDAVHPIQQTTPSTGRIINYLSAALGIMFLLTLFSELGMLKFLFFYKGGHWGFETLFYLLQFFIIPLLTLLFWRRKRAGWILLCIYCSYSIISAFAVVILAMKQNHGESGIGGFLPPALSVSSIWCIVFFGACLWFICKRTIRDVYQVNDRSAVLIAGISAAVAVGFIWGSLAVH